MISKITLLSNQQLPASGEDVTTLHKDFLKEGSNNSIELTKAGSVGTSPV